MFLHISGFIPQLTGGYIPQLALSNSGSSYDAYYITRGERLASDWIINNNPDGTAVALDTYAPLRFADTTKHPPFTAPFVPSTKAYVYHYKNPDTFIANINSSLYYYTLTRKNAFENKIYSNQASNIGKLTP